MCLPFTGNSVASCAALHRVLHHATGAFLYADDLLHSLQRKRAAGGYGEVVMYIEACESGSMFEGLLPGSMGVYVATAANAEESSWGTYCPGARYSIIL